MRRAVPWPVVVAAPLVVAWLALGLATFAPSSEGPGLGATVFLSPHVWMEAAVGRLDARAGLSLLALAGVLGASLRLLRALPRREVPALPPLGPIELLGLAIVSFTASAYVGALRAAWWLDFGEVESLPRAGQGALDFWVHDLGLPSLVHNLLALIFRHHGGVWAMTGLHAGLLTLTLVVLAKGSRALLSPAGAALVVWLVGLYEPLLHQVTEIRAYPTFLLGVSVASVRMLRPGGEAWIVAGLGLAALDSPIVVVLLVGWAVGQALAAGERSLAAFLAAPLFGPVDRPARVTLRAAAWASLWIAPLVLASGAYHAGTSDGFDLTWSTWSRPPSIALLGTATLLSAPLWRDRTLWPALGALWLGLFATTTTLAGGTLSDLPKYLLYLAPLGCVLGITSLERAVSGTRLAGLPVAVLLWVTVIHTDLGALWGWHLPGFAATWQAWLAVAVALFAVASAGGRVGTGARSALVVLGLLASTGQRADFLERNAARQAGDRATARRMDARVAAEVAPEDLPVVVREGIGHSLIVARFPRFLTEGYDGLDWAPVPEAERWYRTVRGDGCAEPRPFLLLDVVFGAPGPHRCGCEPVLVEQRQGRGLALYRCAGERPKRTQ